MKRGVVQDITDNVFDPKFSVNPKSLREVTFQRKEKYGTSNSFALRLWDWGLPQFMLHAIHPCPELVDPCARKFDDITGLSKGARLELPYMLKPYGICYVSLWSRIQICSTKKKMDLFGEERAKRTNIMKKKQGNGQIGAMFFSLYHMMFSKGTLRQYFQCWPRYLASTIMPRFFLFSSA